MTVVGLGPAGIELVTPQTVAAIEATPHRYLRTTRHPSAALLAGATSFDHVYDGADTFEEVYRTIVAELAGEAEHHGEVLYAVPGSPLVLEQTVRLLLADESLECVVLPAMSFLDLAYARLAIDPVESGLRLIDGHQFATAAAGQTGPLLVAHTHAGWVLSDIKLALDDADGDQPVVLLQRLGSPDEAIVRTTWSELDRTVEADHLTCLYIPHLAQPVGAALVRMHQLTRTLREECPWDREQTHASLVRYLVEETYEVVDALQALDPDDPSTDEAFVEELGDLLYQIEFHATIAEQQGRFTIADVATGIHDKLVRRHPHVFGPHHPGTEHADDADAVLASWDAIKRAEKQRTSVFDGVPTSQPSLSYAAAVQRKAAKVGFDWPDALGAIAKIGEEALELAHATDAAELAAGDRAAIADELGDLLFSVVNVARHLDVEPEVALRAAVGKFRSRFEALERLATERGIDLHAPGRADLATLDALWDEVKAQSG